MSSLDKLGYFAKKGRVSRREFMSQAAALGVTTALATSIWTSNAKAAPKKGGRLRVGVGHGSTTDNWDPGTYTDAFMQSVGFGNLRNCLTEFGADDELIPELCESWDSSDAITWAFKLRKGVEFHNGKTLDTNDVIQSMNHHRGKDTKSAAKAMLSAVESIKADGDTVIFKLKSGNADFPVVVSDYHLSIGPGKKEGGVDWLDGIGTGGYLATDFEPGVRALQKRNPNYWKQNAAWFDEIETLAMPDPNARTNALTTGEIDFMDRADIKTVHLLKRKKGVRVEETAATQHYTFPMFVDVPPYDNNHVRMALKLSIDREALLQTILRGHGAVGNDHPISLANRYHNKDLPQRKYDPEKAKWHLKQAGLSSLDIDFSAADAAFAGAVDAAVLYKEHAAKANINVNVVREPNDGYWSNVWLKKPFVACFWSGRPTEDWMFSIAYAEDSSWNDTHYKDPRFNELLKMGRIELDDKKRRAIYYEMQQLLSDEGGVIVPLFANFVDAMSEKLVHGKDTSAAWDLDGMKLGERWWFA
jgi:peptide/nickel transport system substrate-binding protein